MSSGQQTPRTDDFAPGARAVAIAPRSPRYLALDAWRGLACLLVVVFHSTLYAKGPHGPPEEVIPVLSRIPGLGLLGVPIFFVISGYCITATADATRRRESAVRSYFLRRLRRIFPPFWAALALAAVALPLLCPLVCGGIHPVRDPWSSTAWQWVGNLTLSEIWRPHVFGPEEALFLNQSWTLCYEEQFYAVVGLILLVAPRRIFAAAAAVTAATFVVRLLSVRLGFYVNVKGFFFDGSWLLFALGILVYYRVNYSTPRQGHLINAGLLLTVLSFVPGSLWASVATVSMPFDVGMSVATAFALLISLTQRWDPLLATASILRPLRFCGKLCYSLYLVHWPLVKALSHGSFLLGLRSESLTLLVTAPICIAVSVAVAYGFHLAIERRFLNAPPRGW